MSLVASRKIIRFTLSTVFYEETPDPPSLSASAGNTLVVRKKERETKRKGRTMSVALGKFTCNFAADSETAAERNFRTEISARAGNKPSSAGRAKTRAFRRVTHVGMDGKGQEEKRRGETNVSIERRFDATRGKSEARCEHGIVCERARACVRARVEEREFSRLRACLGSRIPRLANVFSSVCIGARELGGRGEGGGERVTKCVTRRSNQEMARLFKYLTLAYYTYTRISNRTNRIFARHCPNMKTFT